jgi:signal transduction histidine kinase
VYSLATAAAPVLIAQLHQTHRDLTRRLVEIEEAREHERALHAQAVLARERAQLAREMHDVVSHQVSLIAVRAGALQVAAKDADAKEAARTIRSLSVTTLDELRTMVTLLRASGGHITELSPQPTLADLRKLVESSGTHVELSGELPTAVGTPAQRALYRAVQEALTNVRKHAPGATACVELWQDGGGIGVTVTNTPPTRPSLSLPGSQQGLVGLRERAELLHGTLDAGPTAADSPQRGLTDPHADPSVCIGSRGPLVVRGRQRDRGLAPWTVLRQACMLLQPSVLTVYGAASGQRRSRHKAGSPGCRLTHERTTAA